MTRSSSIFRPFSATASFQHLSFKRRRKDRQCVIMIVAILLTVCIGFANANNTHDNTIFLERTQQHSELIRRLENNRANDEANKNDIAKQMMSSFFAKLNNLEKHYGTDLVTVQDAADVYPVLSKAAQIDCPVNFDRFRKTQQQQDKIMPCYTPIITIHDRIANSIEQSQYLPQVLLLGGIDAPEHMDMLGPSSIYETLKLLLDCAACEALSPWVAPKQPPIETSTSNDTVTETSAINPAIECRNELQSLGINDELRKWLARLVSTRKIIAVPIVDVAAFHHRLQMEKSGQNDNSGGDQFAWSQCDFPYPDHWTESQSPSNKCMTSFPTQMINEIFRSHAIQLGLAFHGHVDDFLLSSGWIGVPSWRDGVPLSSAETVPIIKSIDEDAMVEIAWAYSMFGGSADGASSSYSVQSIPAKSKQIIDEKADNECRGATLEHWAFSAGLKLDQSNSALGPIWLEQCSSEEYVSEQTGHYDSLSLRSFVASVVASPRDEYSKCLPGFEVDAALCLSEGNNPNHLFDYSSQLGSNLRISLLATELVEPWTSIRSIAGVELRDDDVIPLSQRTPETCMEARSMTLPESALMKEVNITWAVGGAFTVTETAIMHGKWNVLDQKVFDCVTQPTKQELDAFFTILRDFEVMEGETAQEMEDDVSFTPVQDGVTRWHPSQLKTAAGVIPTETTFSVSLDLSDYKVGDVIAIYALARTDQRDYNVENQPQSSFVNIRTNPDWSHTNAGGSSSSVQGRLDWFSFPVTISIGQQPGFFQSKLPYETSVRASDIGIIEDESPGFDDLVYPLLAAVVVVALVFFCAFCREESDGTDVFSILREHRAIKRQKISMEEFFNEEAHTLELT